MTTLSQSVHVSLAYRYWNNQWSHAENQRRYGALASPEGVGGNWRIELGRVTADEASLTKPLAQLKGLVDHRCLFTDLPDFVDRPATLESVTAFLARQLPAGEWSHLTVHESAQSACTVRAEDFSLELRLRVLNLELAISGTLDEDGLMTSREQVTQAVINEYHRRENKEGLDEKTWAETLFETLRLQVKGLSSLRVDLGRRKYIVVKSI